MQDYIKKDAVKRLKTARGHLDHVIGLVESDQYCIDILQQSLAVQAALRAVDNIILEGHLEEHVAHAMGGKDKGKSIKEVVEVFARSRR